jgi:hypothetical protein
VGLKQLLHVTFISALPWLEDCLDDVFKPMVAILHVSTDRKGSSWFFTLLLEYLKSYFETELRIILPDREERLALNY